MRETRHYEGPVVSVDPEDTVEQVADKMDLHAVGSVVVVDPDSRPVGIITDRDLLRRVVAAGRDPGKTSAFEIMTPDIVTGSSDEPLEKILERMRSGVVRRLPILHEGRVVGIVSLDDVVAALGAELADLRQAVRGEVLESRRTASRRHRREEIETSLEHLRGELSRAGERSRSWLRDEVEALRKRFGGGKGA